MRKYIFCFVLCFLSLMDSIVVAQLIANAGPDIIECYPPKQDTIILGGNPTATGGLAPYKYIWFVAIPLPNFSKPASYYLDDTTIANPRLKRIGPEKLKLMVIDANGDFNIDEVQLSFRSPGTHTTDEKVRFIAQGQSTTLFMPTFGGYPPYRYFWTPNYKISDTTATNPTVTPDSTTFYYATIIDSHGCRAMQNDHCRVYVYPTSIDEIELNNNIIEIIPNPVENISIIKLNKANAGGIKIILTNIFGQMVKEFEQNDFGENQINHADFESGLYFIQVFEKNIFLGGKKMFVK